MFKGLTIYQLTQATDDVLEALHRGLRKKPFHPPGKKEEKSAGFVPPLGPGAADLVYEANGCTLFCMRQDNKSIPPAALKLMVMEHVEKSEVEVDTENKTDMRLIKEELNDKLLPGTVAAPSWTFAYIDRPLGMLFVAGSEEVSDDLTALLREAMGGLPVTLLGIAEDDPSVIFTRWLAAPDTLDLTGFELGDSCSLKHPHEGGTAVINVSHDELDSPEMHAMLKAGKQCCRVGLKHSEMDFCITAKLGLRSIMFSDDIKVEVAQITDDHQLASEFSLCVGAVREVMRGLDPLLGGWPKQELLDLKDRESGDA